MTVEYFKGASKYIIKKISWNKTKKKHTKNYKKKNNNEDEFQDLSRRVHKNLLIMIKVIKNLQKNIYEISLIIEIINTENY